LKNPGASIEYLCAAAEKAGVPGAPTGIGINAMQVLDEDF
jgi:hypothetical protein